MYENMYINVSENLTSVCVEISFQKTFIEPVVLNYY
ncbi:hypothetical protein L3N51_02382 [Metallosphaera sp. J1]|nr:hypothetical protein [Metallosphaera javensis (ex Hofmann et al. 2022)]